jgi:hypothetical protein
MLQASNVLQGFGGFAGVHNVRGSERGVPTSPRESGSPPPASQHYSVHPGAAGVGASGNDTPSGRQVRQTTVA